MKSITTEIIIHAPASTIWSILNNFQAYPSWNPFITKMKGNLALGESLLVIIANNGKKNTFKPVVTTLHKEEEFAWTGKLPLGIFNGNHYFKLEKVDEQTTRFVHGEHFSGWLSSPILLLIEKETIRGFEAMNKALKNKAEQAIR